MCVRALACVRACVRACVHACMPCTLLHACVLQGVEAAAAAKVPAVVPTLSAIGAAPALPIVCMRIWMDGGREGGIHLDLDAERIYAHR